MGIPLDIVISIAIMLRIVGSTLSFVSSRRHIIVAATNGSQHVRGCNPLLKVFLSSVERIEDFCDPNPVQHFKCVIQSDPSPVTLSKYLIQSGLYPKKTLFKHWTAVINAVWTSISDPVGILSKSSPVRIRF